MPGEKNSTRWVPVTKGGEFRHWYGNNDYVLNWWNDGWELTHDNFDGDRVKAHNFNGEQAFKRGISWSTISSSRFHCRFVPNGFMFDTAGPFCEVVDSSKLWYVLALMSSSIYSQFMQYMNPTMNFPPGYLESVPFAFAADESSQIESLAIDCVNLSKDDWDSSETSWDFSRSLLLASNGSQGIEISDIYELDKKDSRSRFDQLKANEEELNRIFARIYNMEGEVPIEVEDKYVSVTRIFDTVDDIPESFKGNQYVRTKRDEVVSLLSYAVGCMFGRYSLDVDGLVLANAGDTVARYLERIPNPTYMPDEDGILPILDEEYFTDDIVGNFVSFVRAAYGEETLEENLRWVADALGGVGTSREVIRAYFLKEFYQDHLKTYKKRPIYWMLDSGRKNGFKALVYLHRYTPDTLGMVRTDYVFPQLERYRAQLDRLTKELDGLKGAARTAKNREIKKVREQLEETQAFEQRLHHLADQRIELDLDDGVVVNYAKLQDVLAKIK